MYSASYSSKLFSFSYNNNNGSDGNKDGDDGEFNCDKGEVDTVILMIELMEKGNDDRNNVYDDL